MRYRLRTLLFVLAIGPMVLGLFWKIASPWLLVVPSEIEISGITWAEALRTGEQVADGPGSIVERDADQMNDH